MKRRIKIPAFIIAVMLIVSIPLMAMAAGANNNQSDRDKPVKAENIELVKKVTLKGGAGKAPAKVNTASTGMLGDPVTGNRYAVIIGINDYPGSGSDLQYAVADANGMKNVLMDQYGFLEENITLLTDRDATRSAIKGAVDTFRNNSNITQGDELVFFFSGHGAKGKAADNDRSSIDQSIVVCNGDYTGFDFIWDGELKDMFSNFPINRVVFIFDSCLSGGMSVLKDTGRVVNMACTTSGLSYEGDAWGGGHGQFTYFFAIDGMGLGTADSTADSDTVVTDEEAFDYAKAKCQYQTPTIADGFTNDLLP